MLVLTRTAMEEIIINGGTPDEIRVLIIDVKHGRARVGIEAPKHIQVHRREVYDADQKSNHRVLQRGKK